MEKQGIRIVSHQLLHILGAEQHSHAGQGFDDGGDEAVQTLNEERFEKQISVEFFREHLLLLPVFLIPERMIEG